MTGLRFWFWLLLMAMVLVPVGIIIQYIITTQTTVAWTLGAGALIIIALLALFAFVLTLCIYGWIIITKIRRG